MRWLANEVGLRGAEGGVHSVISGWSGRGTRVSNQLLEAVRLMLPPGSRAQGLRGDILSAAAAGGELDVLRYLHEELGWKLAPELLRHAAISGCEAVMEWLAERVGTDGGATGWDKLFQSKATAGDLATLECMWRLGLRWSAGFPSVEALVSSRMPLQAVQWMWGKAPPPAEAAMGVLQQAVMRAEKEGQGPRAEALMQLLRQQQQGAGQEQQ